MPRNVRPCWFDLSIDEKLVRGSGPKGRSGSGSVAVKVRERGSVLDLLDVDCIGSADGASVLVRVVDKRTGKAILEERFEQ